MISNSSETGSLVKLLSADRQEYCFPAAIHAEAVEIGIESLGLLFPHFSGDARCAEPAILASVAQLQERVAKFEAFLPPLYPDYQPGAAQPFIHALEAVYRALKLDSEAIFNGDPAAESLDEVILTYPGFRAIATYRLAHTLYRLKVPILPRLLTEWAHGLTGVDIHPGADIGRSFFIDHGTGTVIGETCKIGNGVKLYQGVTLGALMVEKRLEGMKRHPTIEDNVVIYANATILGGETVIGHDSVVGGNAWITSSIPAFSAVTRQSAVRSRAMREEEILDFNI